MEMDGLIRYLEDLGLSPEEPSVICLAHLVHAPRLGVIDRKGFREGWSAVYLQQQREKRGQTKVGTPAELISFQRSHVAQLAEDLQEDPEYFETIYKYVFDFGKDEGQKSFGQCLFRSSSWAQLRGYMIGA